MLATEESVCVWWALVGPQITTKTTNSYVPLCLFYCSAVAVVDAAIYGAVLDDAAAAAAVAAAAAAAAAATAVAVVVVAAAAAVAAAATAAAHHYDCVRAMLSLLIIITDLFSSTVASMDYVDHVGVSILSPTPSLLTEFLALKTVFAINHHRRAKQGSRLP